jgi:hypothetical protein
VHRRHDGWACRCRGADQPPASHLTVLCAVAQRALATRLESVVTLVGTGALRAPQICRLPLGLPGNQLQRSTHTPAIHTCSPAKCSSSLCNQRQRGCRGGKNAHRLSAAAAAHAANGDAGGWAALPCWTLYPQAAVEQRFWPH